MLATAASPLSVISLKPISSSTILLAIGSSLESASSLNLLSPKGPFTRTAGELSATRRMSILGSSSIVAISASASSQVSIGIRISGTSSFSSTSAEPSNWATIADFTVSGISSSPTRPLSMAPTCIHHSRMAICPSVGCGLPSGGICSSSSISRWSR